VLLFLIFFFSEVSYFSSFPSPSFLLSFFSSPLPTTSYPLSPSFTSFPPSALYVQTPKHNNLSCKHLLSDDSCVSGNIWETEQQQSALTG
jgi:hypothetical protein